jgi:lipopolysaccharide/colanic/teichoic acid biosynthesis glycosyltransferase
MSGSQAGPGVAGSAAASRRPHTYRGKRTLDLVVGLVALVVSAPVMLVIAVLIWRKEGRPVLYRPTRTGLGERPFTMYKFRTMTEERDDQGRVRQDGERLTRFGAFLRATSLDELPQLLNVVSGEMSLVGPRPLLPQYVGRYSPEQRRRHDARPGLTGWAQVNGRNALSWEERFRLDVWYVDHMSLWLDLRIIAATVLRIARRQGITHPGHASMPEFLGDGTEAP